MLLVILNLLQLNLLYFSSSGSTRCILKAALAMRARASETAAPSVAPVLPGSPLGSSEQLGKPVVGALFAHVLNVVALLHEAASNKACSCLQCLHPFRNRKQSHNIICLL